MNNKHSCIKRVLLAGGLALGVLGTALSGSTAGAEPPPGFLGISAAPISPLKVQALGTEATLTFTTSEPAAVTIDHKPVTAATASSQPTAHVFDGVFQGVTSPTSTQPAPLTVIPDLQWHRSYATTHGLKLTGLKSNTAYDVVVTAETQSGQKHTAQARFTTSKQRVRVTLREINITEDGDAFWMNGEPTWFVGLAWAGGETGGCYPNNGNICETGSHGEGRILPRNYLGQFLSWTFAEENFDTMPAAFRISAAAEEYDLVPILPNVINCFQGGCGYGSELSYVTEAWQVPAGREWASTPVSVYAYDGKKGFDSTMTFTFELFHDNLSYPAPKRNAPQSTWAG